MNSAMECQLRCEEKHVAALGLDNLVDLGRPWNIDRFCRFLINLEAKPAGNSDQP